MKILIVDDEQEILDIHEAMLTDDINVILKATNGQEAIDIINKEKDVDVIVTDLSMPDCDGYKLMEIIKSTPDINQSVSVVFVSGMLDDTTEKKLKDLGAYAVLQKPVDFSTLVDEILFSKVS